MAVTARSLRRSLSRNPAYGRVGAGIVAGVVGMSTAAFGVFHMVQPYKGNGARSEQKPASAEPSNDPAPTFSALDLTPVVSQTPIDATSGLDLYSVPAEFLTGGVVSVVDAAPTGTTTPSNPGQPKPGGPGIVPPGGTITPPGFQGPPGRTPDVGDALAPTSNITPPSFGALGTLPPVCTGSVAPAVTPELPQPAVAPAQPAPAPAAQADAPPSDGTETKPADPCAPPPAEEGSTAGSSGTPSTAG
ncbi:MAG TPA: hypothetical protein VGO92_04785 [Acidimicrobiales bacterium]|jgi:hypothetical protein|nr:hypothetical protein [Acidimicrobiales bacterium]